MAGGVIPEPPGTLASGEIFDWHPFVPSSDLLGLTVRRVCGGTSSILARKRARTQRIGATR